MRNIRRTILFLVALGVGLFVLLPTGAGAQEVTCVQPVATDIRTPSGAIDIQGYTAAVAAYNACVGGVSASRTTAAASAPSAALAFTGSDSTMVVVVAVAAIGLGVGALVIARRRTT
jgi:hypothetical protein